MTSKGRKADSAVKEDSVSKHIPIFINQSAKLFFLFIFFKAAWEAEVSNQKYLPNFYRFWKILSIIQVELDQEDQEVNNLQSLRTIWSYHEFLFNSNHS